MKDKIEAQIEVKSKETEEKNMVAQQVIHAFIQIQALIHFQQKLTWIILQFKTTLV